MEGSSAGLTRDGLQGLSLSLQVTFPWGLYSQDPAFLHRGSWLPKAQMQKLSGFSKELLEHHQCCSLLEASDRPADPVSEWLLEAWSTGATAGDEVLQTPLAHARNKGEPGLHVPLQEANRWHLELEVKK